MFRLPTAPCVLLVDEESPFRSWLSGALSDYGFEVVTESTASASLEMAIRRRPNACILDIGLDGGAGMGLLQHFRDRHVFRSLPVFVVTDAVHKSTLAHLVRLGVKGVYLKESLSFNSLVGKLLEQCPLSDVFGDAGSAFAPDSSVAAAFSSTSSDGSAMAGGPRAAVGRAARAPSRMLMSRDDLQSLALLKALPTVVEDVIDIASRPGTSLEQLERALKRDPVVAARILRSANSAAFLRGGPVGKIQDALQVLGFSNVVRVAVANGIISREELKGVNGQELRQVWCNSLCLAMVAERLSTRMEAARNYAQALFCNLPTLMLIQHLGTEWPHWMAWAVENGKVMQELVEESVGQHLAQFAEDVFGALKVPPALSAPLVDFHRFFLAKDRVRPGLAARRLDLAYQVSHLAGRPGCGLSEIRCIRSKEVDGGVLASTTSAEFLQELDLIEESLGIGGGAGSGSTGRLGELVLWRDPRWATLDPVTNLVASLSDCVEVSSLEELATSDRLKVAVAEPRTPEWELICRTTGRAVVLHSEAVSDAEMPDKAVPIRFPIPNALLRKRLQEVLG